MYIPDHFQSTGEDDVERLIDRHPFAVICTFHDGQYFVSHAPVGRQESDFQFHLARANDHTQALSAGTETLIIFQGPHLYVPPDWLTDKGIVPTWNYLTAHVTGTATPMSDDSLMAHLDAMVDHMESGRETPWSNNLSDKRYAAMRQAIVGFDFAVTKIEAKFKMSQNRSQAGRDRLRQKIEDNITPSDELMAVIDKLAKPK